MSAVTRINNHDRATYNITTSWQIGQPEKPTVPKYVARQQILILEMAGLPVDVNLRPVQTFNVVNPSIFRGRV